MRLSSFLCILFLLASSFAIVRTDSNDSQEKRPACVLASSYYSEGFCSDFNSRYVFLDSVKTTGYGDFEFSTISKKLKKYNKKAYSSALEFARDHFDQLPIVSTMEESAYLMEKKNANHDNYDDDEWIAEILTDYLAPSCGRALKQYFCMQMMPTCDPNTNTAYPLCDNNCNSVLQQCSFGASSIDYQYNQDGTVDNSNSKHIITFAQSSSPGPNWEEGQEGDAKKKDEVEHDDDDEEDDAPDQFICSLECSPSSPCDGNSQSYNNEPVEPFRKDLNNPNDPTVVYPSDSVTCTAPDYDYISWGDRVDWSSGATNVNPRPQSEIGFAALPLLAVCCCSAVSLIVITTIGCCLCAKACAKSHNKCCQAKKPEDYQHGRLSSSLPAPAAMPIAMQPVQMQPTAPQQPVMIPQMYPIPNQPMMAAPMYPIVPQPYPVQNQTPVQYVQMIPSPQGGAAMMNPAVFYPQQPSTTAMVYAVPEVPKENL